MRDLDVASRDEAPFEKQWDTWWTSDLLDAFAWAAMFFWGALVVVGSSTSFSDEYAWWSGWGVFFVGAGAIVTSGTVARLAMPRYRSKWGWSLFWGSAFLALGLGELASPVWYALPLIAMAVVVLAGVLPRRS